MYTENGQKIDESGWWVTARQYARIRQDRGGVGGGGVGWCWQASAVGRVEGEADRMDGQRVDGFMGVGGTEWVDE